MIKLSNIRKTYDGSTYALQGINLDIAKGEIYGIFNQNRLIPENEDKYPQTQEKNTIERKLLQDL